jgi:hypothetical protein
VTDVGTHAFDLTECSRRSYANTRSIRIEFAVIAAVLAATRVGILAYQVDSGTLASSFKVIYGVPYLVAFVGAALLGWGSTKFAPGATWLEIGTEGPSFTFPGRGESNLRWDDRRFSMNLVDARSSPYGRKYGFAGFARIPRRPSTQLTSEALDALVAAAKSHGLVVSARNRGGRWSIAGPLHVWIDVRARDSRHTGST